MKGKTHYFVRTALAMVAMTTGLWAQTQTASNLLPEDPGGGKTVAAAKATPAATPAAPAPVTAADIQALKDALAAQQAQIEALKEQLKMRTQSDAPAAGPSAPAVTPMATPVATATGLDAAAVEGVVAQDQKPADQTQKPLSPIEGPLTIHFRGIGVTPGGYAEGAFVRRSRALGADLPTPFNSLTMPGASQSNLSEFFGSGRQSKITTFVDGKVGNFDVSSYVSADFLSSGTGSNSNQSNSYTLRLRQAWGQVKFDNGWSFLAGQSWSLLTETNKSIAIDDDLGRTNDARPKTIDPSYNVGFVFARQWGLRLTKKINDKVAVAAAIENGQGTMTTHGNGDNFLLGSAGSGSGAYNNAITTCTSAFAPNSTTSIVTTCSPAGSYTFNPSPDVIVKAAFDPGIGHFEVFAMYDRFRDRVFPCGEVALTTGSTTGPCPNGSGTGPNGLNAFNVSRNGGGFGASARFNFSNHLTFGLKGFGGNGIGRYGPAGLPDMTINAWGGPKVLKNGMGLATLEYNAKKLTLFSYAGAEYAGRGISFDPIDNAYVGYGAKSFRNDGCFTEVAPSNANGFLPASLSHCTADTRVVTEGTVGFWYKFFSGPQGSFRYGLQYSYVDRYAWSGQNGITPHGIDGMVFSSFRYYLP